MLTWGWQEVFFLTGAITGPRRHACAADCSGWRHFRHGVQAILHHELSLLVAGAVLVAIGWNAPNPVGMWTYLVLWGMRQSAKLNLFLGVRNLGVEFLPQHLRYLQSFFRRRAHERAVPAVDRSPRTLLVGPARAAHAASRGASRSRPPATRCSPRSRCSACSSTSC